MTQEHPIPDELLNCLEIDEASPSGLSWQTKKTKSGKRAGYLNDKGYWIVRFKGKNYKCHRLILLISGKPQPIPGSEVDHIDRNPSNNLLSNLRWVDRSGNLANRKVLGSVPYRYVHKSRGKYTGQYTHPRTKRQVFVGRFADALSAHLAAVAHRLENHWIDS
jgi:hypothetical protein